MPEPSKGTNPLAEILAPSKPKAPGKKRRKKPGAPAHSRKAAEKRLKSPFMDKMYFLFGIVVPVLLVVFETTTHFGARNFFDPFPSFGHVALFLLIPLTNLMAWMSRYRDISHHYAFLALASGMAAGIGVMYSLMFLPILGLSLIFILAGGFGLLGLAPILSIPCTMRSGATVCSLAARQGTFFDPHQAKHVGHLIVLVMVVAIELPSTITRMHLSLADDPKTASQGIKWLRAFGNREVMLRACYERSGRATDILGSLYESARPLHIDHARALYYRVTGKPFNSVPIPVAARATIKHSAALVDDWTAANANVQDEFDLDADIAGEVVSGVARGLASPATSISGKLDSDALLANLQWNLKLANASAFDREARAKLLLPPGSCVSKATLLMNGIERDATFMVRGKARTHYVSSASAEAKKRDPLLVSTCGPDQILLQCFPIAAGKEAEIRLSLVCPMVLETASEAGMSLPTIIECNFQQAQNIQIALTSAHSFSLLGQPAAGEGMPLSVASTDLARLDTFIHAGRDMTCASVFSRNDFVGDGSTLERNICRPHLAMPRKLSVIVDGSADMRAHLPEIEQALRALPKDLPIQLTAVGDDAVTLCSGVQPADSQFEGALDALKNFEFVAGQDDSPALAAAIHAAATETNNAVLWIHGAQPICMADKDELRRSISAQTHPVLYDFQVDAGPEQILDGLNSGESIRRVPRTGTITADMQRLASDWQSAASPPEFTVVRSNGLRLAKHEADPSLAQLYGYDQILKQIGVSTMTEQPQVKDATNELARAYKVVSPVSSALVTDMPGIDMRVATGIAPEADTWLLLIGAAGLIGFAVISQRRRMRVYTT